MNFNISFLIIFLIFTNFALWYKLQLKENYKNNEAIENVASLYNEEHLQVSNLTVFKNTDIQNFKGIIVAWSGDPNNLPKGWKLCNGKNITPDLRGRFIYGYGKNSADKVDKKGGEEKHKLTIKEMPKHNHELSIGDAGNYKYGKQPNVLNTSSHGNTYKEGGDKPHNNLPPYYVLAYIMYVGYDI
jgi:microcystin-dependent protein